MRDGVRRKKYREVWWLFGEPGAGLRQALAPLERYIATPAVAKHRVFVWLDQPTIPDHALTVFARDDDYFFGVLHSRAHEAWSLRMGTHLGVGNDPRYTPTSTFATFPFPWPPGEEPEADPRVEAVAAAARRLDALRRNWQEPDGLDEVDLKKRTLTNLYNARPTWLVNAHLALDRAVFAAYGWEEDPDELTDEELLGRLLELNARRAGTAPISRASAPAFGRDWNSGDDAAYDDEIT